MREKLVDITDHPKINVDKSDYARIARAYDRYRGRYEKVRYLNSYGDPKTRDYMFINMDKVVGETLADVIFNEQAEITVSPASEEEINTGKVDEGKPQKKTITTKDGQAQEFIDSVFAQNDFKKNLGKYIEPMLVTGGLAARPYVDEQNNVRFSWIQSDSFFPLQNNTNNISECAIPTYSMEVRNGKKFYYTLLEFHEWLEDGTYQVTNELYESESQSEVGTRVPLETMYPGLEETATFPNFSRPLFSYVKPSGFNNLNPMSPLGIGVCDNAINTLKQINDTYDQFNWEIKMGQRRVLVSDHFLRTTFDEQGSAPKQTLDDETNVFLGLQGDMDNMKWTDLTSDIRAEQYIQSINQFIKVLEMQTGLSAGTFHFDGDSVKSNKTATEVVSENSKTFRTRNAHVSEVEKFIKELVISVFELAKATKANGKPLYSGAIPTFDEIAVDFDDGVFTDKTQQLAFMVTASNSDMIPKREAIMRVFNVTEDVAEEWVQEIAKERSREAVATFGSRVGMSDVDQDDGFIE